MSMTAGNGCHRVREANQNKVTVSGTKPKMKMRSTNVTFDQPHMTSLGDKMPPHIRAGCFSQLRSEQTIGALYRTERRPMTQTRSMRRADSLMELLPISLRPETREAAHGITPCHRCEGPGQDQYYITKCGILRCDSRLKFGDFNRAHMGRDQPHDLARLMRR
jgi:hypothetical protein